MSSQDTSAVSSVFVKSAEDLLMRIEGSTSPTGALLAVEASQLVDMLRGWAKQRPTDDERVAAIHRLFDLNRRVMDFLARGSGNHGAVSSSGVRARLLDSIPDDAPSSSLLVERKK